MNYVTAHYLDAGDGRPATEAPLRHGPKLPSAALEVDAVDRRHRPALIIGRIPDDEPLAAGMTPISEQEHADRLADFHAWRAEVADNERAKRLAELAAYRYEVETGGIEIDGQQILTDRQSQSQVNNTYRSLEKGFVDNADWKSPSGWVTVTESELRPIAQAVARHVQACFTAERRVSDKINQGDPINPQNAFDTELDQLVES